MAITVIIFLPFVGDLSLDLSQQAMLDLGEEIYLEGTNKLKKLTAILQQEHSFFLLH